ncbi:MAG: vWA domain-containing protein [Thermodesulfobacteriota bacterium]
MFIGFFYTLKNAGVPVNPNAFLRLQKALKTGLIQSMDDFYFAARTILIKSERYFDIYDQVYAYYFEGAEFPEEEGLELDETANALLEEWLKNPKEISDLLGIDENKINQLSPEELIDYFKERLKEQTERHEGGNKWIGTGGTSPVGHSGYHPGGMRVGGVSGNKSAVKVANERRYKDYSGRGPLNQSMIGEALKRLRNLRPSGPKDQVNVEKSIYQTMKNAGEIEIVFDRSLKDKLKVILAIDNGGWSMDPYVDVVQTLFDYSRAQFKEVKTYFFHNTIYDYVWEDPTRYKRPVKVSDFSKFDPETRFIVIGDASMAPYELLARNGAISISQMSGRPSLDQLQFICETFPHNVWLNPVPASVWGYTRTISVISQLFPMYELSLDGLESAVTRLMSKD